jgi:hypothetical protein
VNRVTDAERLPDVSPAAVTVHVGFKFRKRDLPGTISSALRCACNVPRNQIVVQFDPVTQ